jgi:hypothetical protein
MMSLWGPISLESGTSRRALRIRRIMGSAKELALEVLRLLVLYPYEEQALRKTGISKEETAARLCETLPRPGGVLMTADDGHRLRGLLYMEPLLGPSAAMDMHVWNVGPLIVAPDAPEDTVADMLGKSLGALSVPADFITARVPSADAGAVKGLQKAGFEVVSGEAVAMAKSSSTRTGQKDCDFIPFDQEHLDGVLEIACDCTRCNSFACSQGLEPAGVCRFSSLDLKSYIYERGKNGLVALDSDGRVAGFATYSLDTDIKTPPLFEVGSLDQLCVSMNGAVAKLERSLGTRVLDELASAGVETVVAMTAPTDTGAGAESLRKIGFEVTHSNLVMRRGGVH